jgi:hypothetical protein
VSTGANDSVRRRAVRRRHLHERQAVIFGTLITALMAAGLLGVGVYFGAIPAPFNVPFATPSSDVAAPCPPEGALPVPYDQITVNVYNGTTRTGLAGATAGELAARGLVIGATGNETRGGYDGTVLIRTGPAGLAGAYTVAAIFDGAVVVLDARADATVDVTVGASFDSARPPEQAALDPAVPLTPPEGCAPVGATPAPTTV